MSAYTDEQWAAIVEHKCRVIDARVAERDAAVAQADALIGNGRYWRERAERAEADADRLFQLALDQLDAGWAFEADELATITAHESLVAERDQP